MGIFRNFRGENKTYLKPPTSFECVDESYFMYCHPESFWSLEISMTYFDVLLTLHSIYYKKPLDH